MNLAMFVDSLKYINSFGLVVSLATWIYQELSIINYTSIKLIIAIKKDHFDISSTLIYCNKNKGVLDTALKYLILHDIDNHKQIKLLLDAGAFVDIGDIVTLSSICSRKRLRIIELFIQFDIIDYNKKLINMIVDSTCSKYKNFFENGTYTTLQF